MPLPASARSASSTRTDAKSFSTGENGDKNTPFIEGPEGKLMRSYVSDIPNFKKKLKELPDPEPMVTDFVEAVKTRNKFALNEVNGHRSCTIINLAKIAWRTGRVLHFDDEKQRFIDDDDANKYIKQADARALDDLNEQTTS